MADNSTGKIDQGNKSHPNPQVMDNGRQFFQAKERRKERGEGEVPFFERQRKTFLHVV